MFQEGAPTNKTFLSFFNIVPKFLLEEFDAMLLTLFSNFAFNLFAQLFHLFKLLLLMCKCTLVKKFKQFFRPFKITFVSALFLRFHAVDLRFKLCVLRFHAVCVACSRFVCCVFTLRVLSFHVSCVAFSRFVC